MEFRQLTRKKLAYQLGGFYIVLQLFSLDVFPKLATFCATRKGLKWLRVLSWKMTKGPYKLGYSVLSSVVFNDKVIVLPIYQFWIDITH